MTLRLLTAEDLVNTSRHALAFVDGPGGSVLASGPVRPVNDADPAPDGPAQRPALAAPADPELTFLLGRCDAAEYRIRVAGGVELSARRIPSRERIARREINLPADRPVLLLVEAPDEFEPDGLLTLARLVDGLGRPPLLHPGSALGVPDQDAD